MSSREYYPTASDIIATALGAGSQSDWFEVSQNLYHTFYIDLSAIGVNISFRFEHSRDKVKTYNVNVNNEDSILTKNGNYSYWFNGVRLPWIRLNFVSANGGTPLIDFSYFGGR